MGLASPSGEAAISGVGAVFKVMWLDLCLSPFQRSSDLLLEVFILLVGLGERFLGERLADFKVSTLVSVLEGEIFDVATIFSELSVSFLSLLEGCETLPFSGDFDILLFTLEGRAIGLAIFLGVDFIPTQGDDAAVF